MFCDCSVADSRVSSVYRTSILIFEVHAQGSSGGTVTGQVEYQVIWILDVMLYGFKDETVVTEFALLSQQRPF